MKCHYCQNEGTNFLGYKFQKEHIPICNICIRDYKKVSHITGNADISKFCIEEVQRQRADSAAIAWMIDAWNEAIRDYNKSSRLTVILIERYGKFIEPYNNSLGFRKVQVRVGSHIPPKAEEVWTLINGLVDNIKDSTPEEFYKRFEEIHPFVDGNGRVGKIVYNWLKGTLNKPIMPPNFFGCANP